MAGRKEEGNMGGMTKEVGDKTSACCVLSIVPSYFKLELLFISPHHRLMIRWQPVLSSFPLFCAFL